MHYKSILKSTLSLAAITAISASIFLGCSEKTEIQARPWNEADSCWGPKQIAGTYDTSSGCDDSLALAKDNDGNYWFFTDLCIPDEYTVVNSAENPKMNSAKICGEQPQGFNIKAHQWNETDSCWGPKQFAGTHDSSGCDTATAIAKDSDGNYWFFTNLCIPDGYTVVNSAENPKMNSAKSCDEQTQEFNINAHPWNATDSCWEPAQAAGTYDTSSGCDDALAVAKDSNGNYWQFANLCIPDGYTVENDPASNEMLSEKFCDE